MPPNQIPEATANRDTIYENRSVTTTPDVQVTQVMELHPYNLYLLIGNTICSYKYLDALIVLLLEENEDLEIESCFGITRTQEENEDKEISTYILPRITAVAAPRTVKTITENKGNYTITA